MQWDWEFTAEILPKMLWATVNTLMAAGIGYVIAAVIGLLFALAQRTPFRSLTFIVREVVEFIRSTPLILQIFFVYYVGPEYGLWLSPWVAGMIAIGLHYAAYLSEVYRGGIESIPKGQWEACTAINLTMAQSYRRIILPQAIPPSIAGMGNYLVSIFKDTPMLSVIGVEELMQAANAVGGQNYRYLEPYTIVGVIFLIISLTAASAIRGFEGWIRRKLGME
ncbi:ectoine/hydroxyectoine ABC transporter permease subunit EhuD [Mesorhizobium amorphae]|uniref:Ectoine/hydroxyectoine ABC transporter permease EhuD n=1 Tax=Mesorhizobium amorphae CCNWGS0123 TaxID=1082933 RepID=G6YK81_9HYPH|nr:ectoine/hydroxyectoine ABC transporter permease subunit EhuD [Mesorhizobium amorphae]ANT54860.1 ectoine/hydroxyectoine ABC transporter permease subunit EhuD [Mesorhizobium amorphae CCNWGS0123]EHH04005.1 ectoine/hydroxyectoine ABC transporter permease EhuD [Mesorhizobium amorphae CCNWGS0123]